MTPFFQSRADRASERSRSTSPGEHLHGRLAGELCDGFHVHPFHSIRYLREHLLPEVEDGLAKGGRRRSDLTLSTSAFVITGATGSRDRARARPPCGCRFRVLRLDPRPTSASSRRTAGGDAGTRLTEKAATGDWAGMAREITDEIARRVRRHRLARRDRREGAGEIRRHPRPRLRSTSRFRPAPDVDRWKRISPHFTERPGTVMLGRGKTTRGRGTRVRFAVSGGRRVVTVEGGGLPKWNGVAYRASAAPAAARERHRGRAS